MARIIVAEDEDMIRMLIQEYFVHKGIEVDSCENGEQVLEKLAQTAYDAILTDNNMRSRLSGVEMIKLVRERYGNHFPIYLMSALTLDESHELRKKAADAGATGYISKPFKDLSDLDVVINNLQPTHQDGEANSQQ